MEGNPLDAKIFKGIADKPVQAGKGISVKPVIPVEGLSVKTFGEVSDVTSSTFQKENSVDKIIKEQVFQNRGCFQNVNEALGFDVNKLDHDGWIDFPADKYKDSQDLKKLVTEWEVVKGKREIIGTKEELVFYLEKSLEGGRKAHIVASIGDYEKGTDGALYPVLNVRNLVFQGPKGGCVDFAKRIDDGVHINYRPGESVAPPGAVEMKKRNYWFLGETGEISFSGIESFFDTASLWHEAGHAHDDKNNPQDRELRGQARIVQHDVLVALEFTKGPEEIEKIEERENMDFVMAKFIISKSERYASLWAMEDLRTVKDILDINPSLADTMCNNLEASLRTYDQPYIPVVSASELGRNFPPELKEKVYKRFGNWEEIAELMHEYEEYGLRIGKDFEVDISSVGRMKFGFFDPGMMYFSYYPEDRKQQNYHYISSMLISDVDLYPDMDSFMQEKKTKHLVNCSNPMTIETSAADFDITLETEENIKQLLLEGLVIKEDETFGRIGWIYDTVKAYIPDVDSFDPNTQALKQLEERHGKIQTGLPPEELKKALSLTHREQTICREVGDRFAQDLGVDFGEIGFIFDPNTGERLMSEWDRMMKICHVGLTNAHEPVPDYTLSTDPEHAQKQVIETVVRYLLAKKINPN